MSFEHCIGLLLMGPNILNCPVFLVLAVNVQCLCKSSVFGKPGQVILYILASYKHLKESLLLYFVIYYYLKAQMWRCYMQICRPFLIEMQVYCLEEKKYLYKLSFKVLSTFISTQKSCFNIAFLNAYKHLLLQMPYHCIDSFINQLTNLCHVFIPCLCNSHILIFKNAYFDITKENQSIIISLQFFQTFTSQLNSTCISLGFSFLISKYE